jgi:hypothetical protein
MTIFVKVGGREGLPGSFDFELTQTRGFTLVELVLDHFIDTASAGTFMEMGTKFREISLIARSDDLDLTGVSVAHPATQAKLCRLAMNKPAEADSLHTAADEKVKNHQSFKSTKSALIGCQRAFICRTATPYLGIVMPVIVPPRAPPVFAGTVVMPSSRMPAIGEGSGIVCDSLP